MKTELIVAILSGIVALISAGLSINAKFNVETMQIKHEKELESIKAEFTESLEERKFSFEERRNGYREFFEGIVRYREAQDLKIQADEEEKEEKEKRQRYPSQNQKNCLTIIVDFGTLRDLR